MLGSHNYRWGVDENEKTKGYEKKAPFMAKLNNFDESIGFYQIMWDPSNGWQLRDWARDNSDGEIQQS